MRRLIVYTLVLASLLLSGILLIKMHSITQLSLTDATASTIPHSLAPHPHSSDIFSPKLSSPPSLTNVATHSNQVEVQHKPVTSGNMKRLRALHTPWNLIMIHHALKITPQVLDLSPPSREQTVILNTSPICTIELQYSEEIVQGEKLTLSCLVNSSLEHPTTMNLTLYHPLVGSIIETDLLMGQGETLVLLYLDVSPNCPPSKYNLSLLFNAPEIVLTTSEIPLKVTPAFVMVIMELPDRVVQNQLFEATISVANLGSLPRAITISAENYFYGDTQIIVQPNQTRLVTIMVDYRPQTVTDTGVRLLLFTLSFSEHRLLTVGASLYIDHSAINLLITMVPFGFLFALTLIGIRWLRAGKRSRTTLLRVKNKIPLSKLLREAQLMERNNETHWGSQGIQSRPLAKQAQNHPTQISRKLGFSPTEDNQTNNDRVLVTWEENGVEVQIAIPTNDSSIINRILSILGDKRKPQKKEGESLEH